jgi:hypothetical protein
MPKKKNDAAVEPTNGFSAEELNKMHREAHAELGRPALIADLAKGDPAAYGKVSLALEDHIRWFTTTPEGKLARKKGEDVSVCYITAAFGKNGQHLDEWRRYDANRTRPLTAFLHDRRDAMSNQMKTRRADMKSERQQEIYRSVLKVVLCKFRNYYLHDKRTDVAKIVDAIQSVEIDGKELASLGRNTQHYRRGINRVAEFINVQLSECEDEAIFREDFNMSRQAWSQCGDILRSIIDYKLRQR